MRKRTPDARLATSKSKRHKSNEASTKLVSNTREHEHNEQTIPFNFYHKPPTQCIPRHHLIAAVNARLHIYDLLHNYISKLLNINHADENSYKSLQAQIINKITAMNLGKFILPIQNMLTNHTITESASYYAVQNALLNNSEKIRDWFVISELLLMQLKLTFISTVEVKHIIFNGLLPVQPLDHEQFKKLQPKLYFYSEAPSLNHMINTYYTAPAKFAWLLIQQTEVYNHSGIAYVPEEYVKQVIFEWYRGRLNFIKDNAKSIEGTDKVVLQAINRFLHQYNLEMNHPREKQSGTNEFKIIDFIDLSSGLGNGSNAMQDYHEFQTTDIGSIITISDEESELVEVLSDSLEKSKEQIDDDKDIIYVSEHDGNCSSRFANIPENNIIQQISHSGQQSRCEEFAETSLCSKSIQKDADLEEKTNDCNDTQEHELKQSEIGGNQSDDTTTKHNESVACEGSQMDIDKSVCLSETREHDITQIGVNEQRNCIVHSTINNCDAIPNEQDRCEVSEDTKADVLNVKQTEARLSEEDLLAISQIEFSDDDFTSEQLLAAGNVEDINGQANIQENDITDRNASEQPSLGLSADDAFFIRHYHFSVDDFTSDQLAAADNSGVINSQMNNPGNDTTQQNATKQPPAAGNSEVMNSQANIQENDITHQNASEQPRLGLSEDDAFFIRNYHFSDDGFTDQLAAADNCEIINSQACSRKNDITEQNASARPPHNAISANNQCPEVINTQPSSSSSVQPNSALSEEYRMFLSQIYFSDFAPKQPPVIIDTFGFIHPQPGTSDTNREYCNDRSHLPPHGRNGLDYNRIVLVLHPRSTPWEKLVCPKRSYKPRRAQNNFRCRRFPLRTNEILQECDSILFKPTPLLMNGNANLNSIEQPEEAPSVLDNHPQPFYDYCTFAELSERARKIMLDMQQPEEIPDAHDPPPKQLAPIENLLDKHAEYIVNMDILNYRDIRTLEERQYINFKFNTSHKHTNDDNPVIFNRRIGINLYLEQYQEELQRATEVKIHVATGCRIRLYSILNRLSEEIEEIDLCSDNDYKATCDLIMECISSTGIAPLLIPIMTNSITADVFHEFDNLSFHFLQIVSAHDLYHRRLFIRNEMALMKLKLSQLSTDDCEVLLLQHDLPCVRLRNSEFLSLRKKLLTCSPTASSLCQLENIYYKAPMEYAVSLKYRICLANGIAFIPNTYIKYILLQNFYFSMEQNLEFLSSAVSSSDLAAHATALLSQRIGKLLPPKSTFAPTVDKPLLLSKLNQAAWTRFPLCMRYLHQELCTKYHLPYKSRLQYMFFLRGTGMSVNDVLQYWRSQFTRKMSHEEFTRKYNYSVRHAYGLVGRKIPHEPYDCSKILEFSDSRDKCCGCPFKERDNATLTTTLQALQCDDNTIQVILHERENKRYTRACGVLHAKKSGNINYADIRGCTQIYSDAIDTQHPNRYYQSLCQRRDLEF